MDNLDRQFDDESAFSSRSPSISPPTFPSAWSTPRVVSLARSSEDIIQMHRLPPILSRLDETARVRLACLCEVRDIFEGESQAAEHQYRRMVLIARAYELRLLSARRNLLRARTQFHSAIDLAVRDASVATCSHYDRNSGQVPAQPVNDSPITRTKVPHQTGQ